MWWSRIDACIGLPHNSMLNFFHRKSEIETATHCVEIGTLSTNVKLKALGAPEIAVLGFFLWVHN